MKRGREGERTCNVKDAPLLLIVSTVNYATVAGSKSEKTGNERKDQESRDVRETLLFLYAEIVPVVAPTFTGTTCRLSMTR